MKTFKSNVTAGLGIFLLAISSASAADMASTNYRIRWDVADGGGGLMTSPNYVIVDSVGQPTPPGPGSSTNYQLHAGFHSLPDTDADLIRDFMDNCTLDPNLDQYDSNDDGFGNICDADINNDLTINFVDLNAMRAAFLANPASPNWNPDADLDNSGIINFADLFYMRMAFFGAPGPSGIGP